MAAMGGIEEGEWSSLNGMYNTAEEADFMAQLLGGCGQSFWPCQPSDGSAAPGHDTPHYYSFDFIGTNNDNNNSSNNNISDININNIKSSFCFSQESSSYSGGGGRGGGHDGYHQSTDQHVLSMDFCVGDVAANAAEETSDCNMERSENNVQLPSQDYSEAKLEAEASETADAKPNAKSLDVSKKRSRGSGYHVQKNKRTKWRKNEKSIEDRLVESKIEEEECKRSRGRGLKRQMSSSTCCSVDESNASGESNGGGCGGATSGSSSKDGGSKALNLSGKTRAGRGAATDPQSLYARKRRERINERLRILQGLVPNGTKVDISTMLEEAVEYVKFLQLQIKLLSSDDLWMYAPIAYNGMDIGLDLKLTMPRS